MSNKNFAILIAVVVVGLLGVFQLTGGKANVPDVPMIGQQFAEGGRQHVPADQAAPYNTVPATSGDHGERIAYGEYDRELTDYESLHGLEHGAIAFWYNKNTITDDELKQIRDTYYSLPPFENGVPKAYLSPRTDLDSDIKLAMTAWTYLLNQTEVNTDEMRTFFDGHLNKGPELAP